MESIKKIIERKGHIAFICWRLGIKKSMKVNFATIIHIRPESNKKVIKLKLEVA